MGSISEYIYQSSIMKRDFLEMKTMTSVLNYSKRPLPLDKDFIPAVVWNDNFRREVLGSKDHVPVSIAVMKDKGSVLAEETEIFSGDPELEPLNYFYIGQLVKKLLWIQGGHKIIIGGPKKTADYIKNIYSGKGKRNFDSGFMTNIYKKRFTVECTDLNSVPNSLNNPMVLDRNLDGCRIGFDLGASDRKVSAVKDGKVVFSEEVPWNPCSKPDISYHYHEIMSMLHRAAAHLPRIDAIGGSSAGVYDNNQVRCASIFRAIPPEVFNNKVKDIFLDIQRKWKVPVKVVNDGEVTALAGSMSLKKN